jgi:uncharacterized SAM-binding protein YcdF (DUF218 family)
MNAWIQSVGLDALKPLLSALALPPVPLLLLTLLGAAWLRRRPVLGWAAVLGSVALQWALWTPAGADALAAWLLKPPPTLAPGSLRAPPPRAGETLILVLGGGRSKSADYGQWTLTPISLERLRYGIWLSRASGLPLAFSGGAGPGSNHGDDPGLSEGEIATRIARDEFRHPLRWAEDRSRDTRENARYTVALLREQPVARLVLVTHDLHLPRALRHFTRERDAAGLAFEIVPAPVGLAEPGTAWQWGDVMPSPAGIARSRYALREWLGLLAGA